MNNDGMARLLAKLLDSQIESGQYGIIEKERLYASLTTGPPLNEKEQSLLLLSPVARFDLQQLREEIKAKLIADLKMKNISQTLLPLAAATENDKVILKGNGFNVTLYKHEELGIPWIILVQLGNSYLQAINPMTVLRLVDSGGLEWLRGKPDKNGEITSPWNDNETDLLARSRRFSLTLEPV